MKDLGSQVHKHLVKLGIETPMLRQDLSGIETMNKLNEIQENMRCVLTSLGMNMRDDSLAETPKRVAKMYCQEIFQGLDYHNFPKMTVIENKMKCNEMVAGQCSIKSMCEHHLVPFIGIAHIAYIPKTKILGLSKFNRLADFFARRPQVQERLTMQISAALQFVLGTMDVAVVVKATHFCVKLRGVQDENSETTTSQMGGRFMKKPELRAEFLALTR